ncbi:MAG: hypothetical protein AB1730_03135 [Myxococcota bacterium]
MADASTAPVGTAPRQPGRFGRAEGAARRAVLMVGLGIAAYVIGGFVMSGLAVRLGERFGAPTSETAAWLLQWALVRTWLWAVLPVFGWGVGRYLAVPAMKFALTSVSSAELFGLLLATASDGLDWVLGSPGDMVMRALTLAGGVGLVAWSVQKGLAAADAAQAEANVEANKRKAEYAEFLARAEGKRD